MNKLDLLNSFFKMFFISIFVYYTYIKIIDLKNANNIKNLIIICYSLIISAIYAILKLKFDALFLIPIIYLIFGVLLSTTNTNKINYSILITIISFIIVYGFYIISLLCALIFSKIFFNIKNLKSLYILIFSIGIEFIFLYNLFKLRRFKKGFYFLKDFTKVESISIFYIALLGIFLIIRGVLKITENNTISMYIFCGFTITTIGVIIGIRSRITKQYKENMQIRTIDIQKEEIKEKDKIIEKLKEENMNLSSTIHKYNNRFGALQSAIIKTLNDNVNEEISTELNIMLKDLNKMSNDFTNEVTTATNKEINLPKTNIYEIDNIFQYMASMSEKDNIKLNLKINNNINGLIEKYVSKEDLATMIGDHIKDAIIAINHSNNDKKQIMVILGIVNGCYEFSIYDTGIEFEINTLLKLGKERATTHKDEGGTGIGFMTTFETLNKCKGSIIIEEYDVESYYTKQITFRFDGLSEYKIHSYRESEIKEKDKQGRIIFY